MQWRYDALCIGKRTGQLFPRLNQAILLLCSFAGRCRQDKRLKYQNYRFSVAPMMDWTNRNEKAKPIRYLSAVTVAGLYQMQY